MMPAQQVQNLERNLARLRAANPGLAEAVLQAEDPGLEVVVGPRGHSSVSEAGVLLASVYDPVREGHRLAVDMSEQPVDLLVAVGFGLGHHVAAFRARNPCPMIIYEPSRPRLQAALRASPDLAWLESEEVVVTDDPEKLRGHLTRLYRAGMRVKVYPHPSLQRLDPGAVREATRRVARAKASIDREAETRQSRADDWAEATIGNARHLIQNPSVGLLRDAFAGVPAVICAAGPSLTRQLPALERHRDRVLVIAIGQSLGALRAAGIEPDLVHVVDSQDVAHQLHDAGDTECLDLVLPPQAHPSLFDVPVRRRWVSFHESNPFACWMAEQLGAPGLVAAAGTVVQCSVHLARELGCGPITLIGQDLAFTDGRIYAEGTSYDQVGYEETRPGEYRYTGVRDKLLAFGSDPDQEVHVDLVWVEGWNGERLPTSSAYASYIDGYREIAGAYAEDGVRLLNCTEGGARIPGLTHAAFEPTLEELAPARIETTRILEEAHREFFPPVSGSFDLSFVNLRRILRELWTECGRGLAQAESTRREFERGAAPTRQISLLRGLGRTQAGLRSSLRRAGILDALVQRELHSIDLRTGRQGSGVPSPLLVVAEGEKLMQATRTALDRARTRIDRLELELAEGF